MGSKPSKPTVEQNAEMERKEIDRDQEIENVEYNQNKYLFQNNNNINYVKTLLQYLVLKNLQIYNQILKLFYSKYHKYKYYQMNYKYFLSNIERVIEGNANLSLPTLMQLFSEAIAVQKPELYCFKEIVKSMKKNWNKLSKCLDAFGAHVNNRERKSIISLQKDYWGALVKTGSVIQLLVKKCSMKQRDVRILLKLIKIAANNNGELSNDEISAHRQCVQGLGKWIEVAEIQTLYDEWADLGERLKKQQMSWKDKLDQLKENSKHLGMSILKGIGILLAGAGIISLIIFGAVAASAASHGAATPVAVAAGGAAVKTVTVFGVSLLAKHAVGLGVSLGVLGAGCISLGGYSIWKRGNAACQAYKNANKVTTMLAKMIAESGRVGNEMRILDDKLKQDAKTEFKYLIDVGSRITMKESLLKMDEHLSEYMKQGQEVIKSVNSACKTYIQ